MVKPTFKQKRAFDNLVGNGGKKKNITQAMLAADYTPATANTPQKLTESEGFKALMKDAGLDDKTLLKKHVRILNAHHIEHMVFPLAVTDKEIKKLLASVNCTPKKFMHGETANHVWFWSPDNKSQISALDLAYKIGGKLNGSGPIIPVQVNVLNDLKGEFA